MFNIHYKEKTGNQLEYEEANEGCKNSQGRAGLGLDVAN